MHFMDRNGWYCRFLDEDLKASLPRKLIFADKEKLVELARRGGCHMNLEVLQAFEHALSIGRGGVWLTLTDEQYRKLK
jgi:hypothetical protein